MGWVEAVWFRGITAFSLEEGDDQLKILMNNYLSKFKKKRKNRKKNFIGIALGMNKL